MNALQAVGAAIPWGAVRQVRVSRVEDQAVILTITPTAETHSQASPGTEVFAVIAGKKVYLPVEAKYVMQDRRGLWFYSTRKPRQKEGDWTPNKTSIACLNERGYVRALKTESNREWLETCQRTVRMVQKGGARRAAED